MSRKSQIFDLDNKDDLHSVMEWIQGGPGREPCTILEDVELTGLQCRLSLSGWTMYVSTKLFELNKKHLLSTGVNPDTRRWNAGDRN